MNSLRQAVTPGSNDGMVDASTSSATDIVAKDDHPPRAIPCPEALVTLARLLGRQAAREVLDQGSANAH